MFIFIWSRAVADLPHPHPRTVRGQHPPAPPNREGATPSCPTQPRGGNTLLPHPTVRGATPTQPRGSNTLLPHLTVSNTRHEIISSHIHTHTPLTTRGRTPLSSDFRRNLVRWRCPVAARARWRATCPEGWGRWGRWGTTKNKHYRPYFASEADMFVAPYRCMVHSRGRVRLAGIWSVTDPCELWRGGSSGHRRVRGPSRPGLL